MKISRALRALALGAVVASSAFATPPLVTSELDPAMLMTTNPRVTQGMSREAVQFMLGNPGAKLSADFWVYWNFKLKGVPGSDAFDALVVGFSGGRVALLKLGRSEPLRAFIAQQKVDAMKTSIVAK
jgi:hypothetical protein